VKWFLLLRASPDRSTSARKRIHDWLDAVNPAQCHTFRLFVAEFRASLTQFVSREAVSLGEAIHSHFCLSK
jgi:hypothetical protein